MAGKQCSIVFSAVEYGTGYGFRTDQQSHCALYRRTRHATRRGLDAALDAKLQTSKPRKIRLSAALPKFASATSHDIFALSCAVVVLAALWERRVKSEMFGSLVGGGTYRDLLKGEACFDITIN